MISDGAWWTNQYNLAFANDTRHQYYYIHWNKHKNAGIAVLEWESRLAVFSIALCVLVVNKTLNNLRNLHTNGASAPLSPRTSNLCPCCKLRHFKWGLPAPGRPIWALKDRTPAPEVGFYRCSLELEDTYLQQYIHQWKCIS